jgi:hypothetical protein
MMNIPSPDNPVAPAVIGFETPLVHELSAAVYDKNPREENGLRRNPLPPEG